jgi:RNA polymerase sigma-70 factor (ECF subfamily)
LPKPVLFDESDVLKRLAEGNEDAFNHVYTCYSPMLYSEALRFLRSRELAEDFVQEIFTTVWDKRETFTEVEYLTTYLLTMGKNLAYQYWLRLSKEDLAKKEMAVIIKNQQRVVENELEGKELENLLERTLELLPRQQKQVFHLAKSRGLSYKAISELLNISPNTVKNHIIAANQFIRKRLGYASSMILLCVAFVYHLLAK